MVRGRNWTRVSPEAPVRVVNLLFQERLEVMSTEDHDDPHHHGRFQMVLIMWTSSLAAKQATEEKELVVPSSCLEGLGILGTGQTGKLPRAATALTR